MRLTMKHTAAIVASLVLWSRPVGADDECKVEDWRWYVPYDDSLAIQGASNCEKGRIVIRVYKGEGEEKTFLGVADGLVEGYAFEAVMDKVDRPASIVIRYSIDPDGY